MILTLDIGNTRTKLGLFYENKLVEQAIWPQPSLEDILALVAGKAIKGIIVSNVSEPIPDILEMMRQQMPVLELTPQTPLPFRNTYATPETLGKDRLATVAGAQALAPGQHCMVVDCGTCIKYELLLAAGEYAGGNIAPGIGMRLQAMHHFTARLPLVKKEMPETMIGFSTETALQNGGLRGAALEIEGFIQLFRQKISPLHLILTGGDAAFIQPYVLNGRLSIEPDLTLIGLHAIYRHQFSV